MMQTEINVVCKDALSHYSTDVSLVQFNNDLELSINQ